MSDPRSRLAGLLREQLGQQVRQELIDFVREQPSPVILHPAPPWEELAEIQREMDRRIGTALYLRGYGARDTEIATLLEMVTRLQVEKTKAQTDLEKHRFELLDALGIVGAEEDTDPYEAVRGLHAKIDRLRDELANAAGGRGW